MSTGNSRLTVRGIDIEIVSKDIKNLHIGVYPPDGRVRVAAPKRLDEDRIRLAVIQRPSWIKQQQKQLRDSLGLPLRASSCRSSPRSASVAG